MTPEVIGSAPVFRSFDEAKARGFYVDWLGFEWTGEYRLHAGAPVYAFLRLGTFRLHLSEHHGDAIAGSTAMVFVKGLAQWYQELSPYPNMRPGLETLPWGEEMVVTDPFGNRLRFLEQADGA